MSYILNVIERFHSEHEPIIRGIVSKARDEYFRHIDKVNPAASAIDRADTKKGYTDFGDCEGLSCHVAKRMKDKYPSAKLVQGKHYWDQARNFLTPHKDSPHAWVEIPETRHFVDPSHDQFQNRYYWKGKAPKVKGKYPDNLVKVGSMDSEDYKSNYHKLRVNKSHGMSGYRKDTQGVK